MNSTYKEKTIDIGIGIGVVIISILGGCWWQSKKDNKTKRRIESDNRTLKTVKKVKIEKWAGERAKSHHPNGIVVPEYVEVEKQKIETELLSMQPEIEKEAKRRIKEYEACFNNIYDLDNADLIISIAAGILGGLMDFALVGIPHPGREGVTGGVIDVQIREWFDKKFPEATMERIAQWKGVKVPFDAQDNRHLHDAPNIEVDGLSAYLHRLLSLGHDPALFLVGIYDIMNGTMTTISKSGVLTSQEMPLFANRMSTNVLEAMKKLWLHLKTDVNTSMSLPVPLMSLFNFLQFGTIGEEKLTIAEVVQGMYYDGYDFQHFCTMSIPTMFVEIIVRAAWWIRAWRNNKSLLKTTPVVISNKRNPKLETMLCLAHSVSCSINAMKVGVKKDPSAINYAEWLRAIDLLLKELPFRLIEKPIKRLEFVNGKIMEDYYKTKK